MTQPPFSIRTTTLLVLAALVADIVIGTMTSPPDRTAAHLAEGQVTFDLCVMWEQMSAGRKLGALVWFVSLIYFVCQGLRNRCGPGWFAVAGLLSVLNMALADGWRIKSGCYSKESVIAHLVWLGTVCALFIHHALLSQTGRSSGTPWLFVLFRVSLFAVLLLSITAEAIGFAVNATQSTSCQFCT